MLFTFLGSFVVFCVVVLGLAWPLAARLALAPAEKIAATAVLSLLGVFLFGWGIYVWSLPLALFQALPVLAGLGLGLNRRSFADAVGEAEARTLLAAQLIITGWSVGGLALIQSYSGGGWTVDWWAHMQRTWFFLDQGPRDILFGGYDALTSRPPLANVVNGALLVATQRDFAHYQFFSTLFSSLVFLPSALLARRFGGDRAIAVLAVLFMVNPMFAENVTYAWTKLPAAFFAISALYFFLRANDTSPPKSAGMLFALSLASGLLAHYSTGPYAVLLALMWLGQGWARRREITWWRITAFAALAALLVLATWFGWAFAVFGWKGTVLTNTSFTDQASTAGAQFRIIALNLRDTFVPHFFRTVDFTLITQRDSLGWWRDWFFNLYQTNFFFAFGSVTWAGIIAALALQWRGTPVSEHIFWALFVTGTITVGIVVIGARDTWGLAQICLQPIVLLGLTFLAARWPGLARPWRLLVIAGATVDFFFGIVLQFWVESESLSLTLAANHVAGNSGADYSPATQMNLYAKVSNHWLFVGDLLAHHAVLVTALLAVLFLLAVIRAGRNTPATDSK